MEELGEVKIKLDVGGVVRNDTILEVDYLEGSIYHYKVLNKDQLQESLVDFLMESCYSFRDLWLSSRGQDGIVEITCTLFTDDGEHIFYVLVPTVGSAYEFYKYAFGLVAESLGYKVSYLK